MLLPYTPSPRLEDATLPSSGSGSQVVSTESKSTPRLEGRLLEKACTSDSRCVSESMQVSKGKRLNEVAEACQSSLQVVCARGGQRSDD